MISAETDSTETTPEIRRVLVLADESAGWRIAGLRQLDRIALTLHEHMRTTDEPLTLAVFWRGDVPRENRWLPDDPRLRGLVVEEATAGDFDLLLSTRVFLYRNSLPQLIAHASPVVIDSADAWQRRDEMVKATFADTSSDRVSAVSWRYVAAPDDAMRCEREFLRNSGKSQDGLASRFVNRPISRLITRLLLRCPITPSAWSVSIFALPLCASAFFLRGTDRAFLFGCLIFQLYSILDGCDGEIARATFQQTESGRRLDSFLDLVGNIILALALGVGLGRQWDRSHMNGWLYIAEGIAAAACIVLSEGIVFVRRSRVPNTEVATKWNGALYQRHHEFLERSGILFLGDKFAWWLVQMTKRDMAMLAFVLLAAIGAAGAILHLLLAVSGVSAALAGNAFFRQPAPALPQEAS